MPQKHLEAGQRPRRVVALEILTVRRAHGFLNPDTGSTEKRPLGALEARARVRVPHGLERSLLKVSSQPILLPQPREGKFWRWVLRDRQLIEFPERCFLLSLDCEFLSTSLPVSGR